MSSVSNDLQNFLEVVAKVASSVAESSGSLGELRGPLESAGLLDLARDTAEEPDALQWLAHTVRVAAESSPSLGFALAARYAADRALATGTGGAEPTFGLVVGSSLPVIAAAFEPETVVLLDVETNTVRAIPWAGARAGARDEQRTGLKRAELTTFDLPASAEESAPATAGSLAEWDMLTGAVLIGIGRRACRTAGAYVLERRQFGVPIASFAGLRALIAEMELRMDGVEALFDRALDASGPTESISAAAGKAVIDTCVDAIQALGGYGYIDEYPVSGLLRDAISVQSRAGGRRLHVSRVATRVLGPREVGKP